MEVTRCFVAIPLPEAVRADLVSVGRSIDPGRVLGVRWVGDDRLHLTLAFLGAVPDSRLEELRAALAVGAAGVGLFTLSLGEAGAFPSTARPRVVYVGLDGELAALGALQARIASALESAGFDFDRKAFRPHLTIGRLRQDARAATRRELVARLGAPIDVPRTSFRVDAVELVASHLGAGPPRHEPLARYPLATEGT